MNELEKALNKLFSQDLEKYKPSRIKQCPLCKTWTDRENATCPHCNYNYFNGH